MYKWTKIQIVVSMRKYLTEGNISEINSAIELYNQPRTNNSLYFVTIFPPIECGIGSHTQYLIDSLDPTIKWGVVGFDPSSYGATVRNGMKIDETRVSYPMRDPFNFDPVEVYESINKLDGDGMSRTVIIQHSQGVWKDSKKFTGLLRELKEREENVVVTYHTIHFQDPETDHGLKRYEYDLLNENLPYIDAMTVFSNGAYQAVTSSFPEHSDKVALIRLGAPSYDPMEKSEARNLLFSHLIDSANIDRETKSQLSNYLGTLLDSDTLIIGNGGFVQSRKSIEESTFNPRDIIDTRNPGRNIISLFIGDSRNDTKSIHRELKELSREHDGRTKLFIDSYIPENLYSAFLNSFDVMTFWPKECTQSGRLIEAQSAGVAVAGKDMEGLGETLKLSGCPAATTFDEFVEETERLLLDPEYRDSIISKGHENALTYSSTNQARKYVELADAISSGKKLSRLDIQQLV